MVAFVPQGGVHLPHRLRRGMNSKSLGRVEMRIAERVTFGGSGLDRAAGLRDDPTAMARLLAAGRVLPMWRGKPLIQGEAALGFVAGGAAVLAGAEPPIFLGQDDSGAIFAQDLSAWVPEVDAAGSAAGFFDATRQGHPAVAGSWTFQELRSLMARLSVQDAEIAATAKALMEWHRSHGFCAACGARSDVSHAGWQRSCAACNAQHFPRTDPVVIMLIENGNSLLLGRNAAWPEGMYSLLAGFVEPGETIEAAVRREVVEETGVKVGRVRYLASQPWPFPNSLMFGCWGEALSDTITLDPRELQDALWVSREEMVTVVAGVHPRIKPSRKGAIAHFLIANWLADRLD